MNMPQELSPDWAVSCMERINKFDDPDVLDAVMELVNGVHCERGNKGDAAQAALRWAYQQTPHCAERCREYLALKRIGVNVAALLVLLTFFNLIF